MNRLFKNSTFYAIGELFKAAGALLLLPLYTRVLSPTDFGIISFLSVIVTFMSSLLILGQSEAIMRFFFDTKDPAERKKMISSIWLFSITVYGLFLIAALLSGNFLFSSVIHEVSFYPYGLILSGSIFLSIFFIVPMTLLRAEERAFEFALSSIIYFSINVALIFVAVFALKKGAVGKISADVISGLIGAIFFSFLFKKYWTFSISFQVIKKTLRFGLPLVIHNLALWILNLSDRFIIQLFLPISYVGIYAVG